MWVTADSNVDLEIPISYMVDGDYVIPTSAGAIVRVGTDASAVTLPTITLDVSTTSARLVVPAQHLTLRSGRQFETLFITIRFIADGAMHEDRKQINVVPFIPMTATEHDVRQILGLPAAELDNSQIRLVPAYFRLLTTLPTLRTILEEGSARTLSANRAIAIEAALELLPSLRLRVGQKMKSEDQEFARFQGIDWSEMQGSLEAELDKLVNDMNNVSADDIGFAHFAWAGPTDALTGG